MAVIKPVEIAWTDYRTKCIPPCLHPEGVERLKEAFYCGYLQAMKMVQKVGEAAETGGTTKLAMDEVCVAALVELESFQIEKGPARN